MRCLENSDLSNLCKKGAEIGVISSRVKKSFWSLDSDLPRPRVVRYLLLQVQDYLRGYYSVQSKDPCSLWLDLIGRHGVHGRVLDSIRHGCSVSTEPTDLCRGDEVGRILLMKNHIPDLIEILSGSSHKWWELGVAVRLPESVLSEISQVVLPSGSVRKCLYRVLTEWIVGQHKHAKAPTVENLKKALASETVNLGSKAGELLDKMDFVVPPEPTVSCLEKPLLGTSPPSLAQSCVIALPHCVEVAQGKSTLLEVVVNSAHEQPVHFQWKKDGLRLQTGEFFLGPESPVLCISATVAAKGSYTCEVTCGKDVVQCEYITLNVILSPETKRLVDLYTLSKQPRDSWPPVHKTTYINLALIKQGGCGSLSEFARFTIQGNVDDVESEKVSIEYYTAFGKYHSGVLLLVEGRPGSGKTTLMHKVCEDWASSKLVLIGARLVFLISLRVVAQMPDPSMVKILDLFYHDESTAQRVLSYIVDCNGEGVCFIMDGFDEFVTNEGDKSIVLNVIHKQYLQKSMVIVASRPVATEELKDLAHTRVEVLGFLSKQIYEYIESYHFKMKVDDVAQKLKAYLSEHPNILHMCYLPVHAVIVCFLCDKMKDLPHTETDIYKHFTMLTILRSLKRHNPHAKLSSLDCLSGTAGNYFLKICKIAFEMTISSKQVFDSDLCASIGGSDQQTYEEDSNSDSHAGTSISDESFLGLVTVDRAATLYDYKELYTFVHLTFQEFLAAYHVSRLEEEEQMKVISKYGKEKHMLVVWKFYSGLVKFKNQSKFEQLLILNEDRLFHCWCAFESQDPANTGSVVLLDKDNGLTFKGHKFYPLDFHPISYVTSNTDALKQLTFSSCHIEGCVELLANCLKHCTHLEYLELSECGIDDCVQVIAPGLIYCIHLQSLILAHNNIGDNSAAFLASSIRQVCANQASHCSTDMQWHGLHTLNLSYNKIGLEGAKYLGEGLKHCSAIHTLILYQNQIGDEGAKCLGKGLKYCSKLYKLSLAANKIGDVGAKGLGEGLKCCSNLYELSLSTNQIGDEGAKGLGEGLKCCFKLYKLVLSYNRIGDVGAKGLGEGLKHCSAIHILSLFGNEIGDEGAKGLSEGLKCCSKLYKLVLSYNRIGDEGAKGLGEGLKCCSKLYKLYLSDNRIGDEGAKGLGEGLKCCSNLYELNLYTNKISDVGAKSLREGLKYCPELRV